MWQRLLGKISYPQIKNLDLNLIYTMTNQYFSPKVKISNNYEVDIIGSNFTVLIKKFW